MTLHKKVQEAINSAHGGFLSGNVTDAAIRTVLEWAEKIAADEGVFYASPPEFVEYLKREAGK